MVVGSPECASPVHVEMEGSCETKLSVLSCGLVETAQACNPDRKQMAERGITLLTGKYH